MLRTETKQIGKLTCRIVDFLEEGEQPEVVVVLCHGFGAPGTDLVGLSSELFSIQPELAKSVRFVFPEAPNSLAEYGYGEGRAWWMIDMMALQVAMESGDFREMRNEIPDGLVPVREMLAETIQQIQEEAEIGWNKTVLGGFSQGSMLTTDLTLHLDENPAGLVVYSGTVINESEWRKLAPNRAGLNVVQSHGLQDPILPYHGAELLRDLLTESGMNVEFISFPSVHTIPGEGLVSLSKMLTEVLSS